MDETSLTAPAVTHEQDAIMFAALELSGGCWLVALQAPGNEQPSRHRVTAGDAGELVALLERQRARAEHRLGRGLRVVSCHEAGWDGFWLHRVLARAGIENHVMDAASLAVSRRARRAKTDRLDAALLLRALMAWRRGEVGVCAMVRVPTVEQEDAKRTGRERARLIPELASTLEREVLYRAFANRREVASYVGLTPSPYASGGMEREQGISKAGNARARRAMVELAWLWLRHQPASDLSRWFRTRVGLAAGRVRRIAVVALARKLLVALWRYASSGLVPSGAVVKA